MGPQDKAKSFLAIADRATSILSQTFLLIRGTTTENSRRLTTASTKCRYCLYHGIDIPEAIKKICSRFTEKRFKDSTAKISALVHKRMPLWAKKFNGIWNKLTDE